MFKVLIVDDNSVARIMLAEMLKKVNGIEIVGECESAMNAHEFLKKEKIDILFLDIEMPGMSGVDLLKILTDRPLTVFVSAKAGYAVEAFELNVVDYLVKPFSFPRVFLAVEKATELLGMQNSVINEVKQDRFFIRDNKAIRKILLEDILWMESKGDYVKIVTINTHHIIHSTLKSLEEKLSTASFARIHRSYLIPIAKIDYIEDGVLYIQGTPLPVSETYRNDLLKSLQLI